MSVLLGDNWSGSDERESEGPAEELGGVGSLDLRVLDLGSLNDLNVAGHGSVTTSHVIVHLTNSTGESHVSVLLVHIVGTASGPVSEPDSEVLNLGRGLIEDLEK